MREGKHETLQNGDRCPCCGTVLAGKTAEWLAEFSQLVADLGLTEWPQPEMRAAEGADLAGDREGRPYGRTAEL